MQEPATPASDVYSFGVLLLELATLTRPLYDLDQMAIMGQIGFGGRRLSDEIPADCDERFADVIRQCLCVEPGDRIDVGLSVSLSDSDSDSFTPLSDSVLLSLARVLFAGPGISAAHAGAAIAAATAAVPRELDCLPPEH